MISRPPKTDQKLYLVPYQKKNMYLNTHTNLAKKKNKINRDDKLVRKKKKKNSVL